MQPLKQIWDQTGSGVPSVDACVFNVYRDVSFVSVSSFYEFLEIVCG